MSLCTRQVKVKCLAWLSELPQSHPDQPYLPGHASEYVYFSLAGFFTSPWRLFLTSYHCFPFWSHQGIIRLSKARCFLLRWVPPPRNESKSRNRHRKLAWWSALLTLPLLLMNYPLTIVLWFSARPCYFFCLRVSGAYCSPAFLCPLLLPNFCP